MNKLGFLRIYQKYYVFFRKSFRSISFDFLIHFYMNLKRAISSKSVDFSKIYFEYNYLINNREFCKNIYRRTQINKFGFVSFLQKPKRFMNKFKKTMRCICVHNLRFFFKDYQISMCNFFFKGSMFFLIIIFGKKNIFRRTIVNCGVFKNF